MSQANYKIRKATTKDLDFVKRLDRKNMTPILSRYNIKYMGGLFQSFNPDYCFIIENKKEKIGFAYIEIAKKNLEIVSIQMKSKYQRKGFGKRLIEYLIEFGKKKRLKKIILEAHKTNEKSVNFHKKIGFNVLKQRRDKIKFEFNIR